MKTIEKMTVTPEQANQILIQSWDREVNDKHVKRLMLSIQENNMMEARPVVLARDARGNLFNVDGKHRMEACKRLGIDFPAVVVNDGAQAARLLNTSSVNWKNKDFLNFYAERGYTHYIALRKLMEDIKTNTGVSPSFGTLTPLLSLNRRDHKDKNNFFHGEWKLSQGLLPRTVAFYDFCVAVKRLGIDANKATWANAFLTLSQFDSFDPVELASKLAKYVDAKKEYKPPSGAANLVRSLVFDVYEYRRPGKTKLGNEYLESKR